jgi:hypothetical protein
MIPEEKSAAPDRSTPERHVEPPEIFLPACGALCDIFWWARRSPVPSNENSEE